MSFKLNKFLYILLLLSQATAFGQHRLGYELELGGSAATGSSLPFWMVTNKFGVIPSEPNNFYFHQRIYRKPDSLRTKKPTLNYGFELDVFTTKTNQFIIPEAFLQPQWGPFYLMAGRKKQYFGLNDSTLSSGSMTWSGNTLPLPTVQIGLLDYQKIFFRWLAVKGHLSHGWFQEQTFVKNYYLHQKSFYVRLGTPTGRLRLYGGILHNVQWGGTPLYEIGPDDIRFVNGKFPSDWFTYTQVFFPRAAVVDTTLGYAKFETENRFGAHIGQFDLGGDVRLGNFRLLGYRNIPIETGRTIGSLSNLDDGLYGLSLTNLKRPVFFKKLVLEYLYTMNQHSYQGFLARMFKIPPKTYMNDAFLFNHQQYRDGWSYNGETIGSPFLIPQSELRSERKLNQPDIFTNNNRIKAFYAAFNGQLNGIDVTFKTSFSKNFGTLGMPLSPISQNSYYISLGIPLRAKASLRTTISLDQGDLIYDNYGFRLGYFKAW